MFRDIFTAYFKIDIEGKILEVNTSFKDLLSLALGSYIRDICLDWEDLERLLESKKYVDGVMLRFLFNQKIFYMKTFIIPKEEDLFHVILVESPKFPLEENKFISGLLLRAQEEERKRISRELHDEIGQTLTAIKMNLELLKRQKELSNTLLEDSISIIDRAINQVRDLSLDLRPSMLDDLGLKSALRWYLNRQRDRSGISIEFDFDFSETEISQDLAITVFRVVQEAITNSIRHSKAKNIFVEIKKKGKVLELLVQDDGVGFDMNKIVKDLDRGKFLGILSMKERVELLRGKMKIESKIDLGTKVKAKFPLEIE